MHSPCFSTAPASHNRLTCRRSPNRSPRITCFTPGASELPLTFGPSTLDCRSLRLPGPCEWATVNSSLHLSVCTPCAWQALSCQTQARHCPGRMTVASPPVSHVLSTLRAFCRLFHDLQGVNQGLAIAPALQNTRLAGLPRNRLTQQTQCPFMASGFDQMHHRIIVLQWDVQLVLNFVH